MKPDADVRIEIGIDEIRLAAERLKPWIHVTPVLTSKTLDQRCGGRVFLKCENFQKVGAFKFRGAMNALLQLSGDTKKRGAITHSSGNHGQALAAAGALLGIPVCVVMPYNAPEIKKQATIGYGAKVVYCEPTIASREAVLAIEAERQGSELVHPYNDWRVIAGQATAALELLEQTGSLDIMVAPVGGGGLISGTSLAVKAISPETKVFAAEPKAADDAYRSLQSGRIEPSDNPRTMADGLRSSLGLKTFAVISKHLEAIVTVDEPEILDALRFVWERLKIIIEPSSAVPVAALLNGAIDVKGRRAGVILTGGNIDLEPFFQAFAAKWL